MLFRSSGPGPGADAGTKRDPRSGGPGNPSDRRGGGSQGGGSRNAPPPPANGAMAEALRRAGLVNEKGTQAGKQDRRSNRP